MRIEAPRMLCKVGIHNWGRWYDQVRVDGGRFSFRFCPWCNRTEAGPFGLGGGVKPMRESPTERCKVG
jgi:hypothetical protein